MLSRRHAPLLAIACLLTAQAPADEIDDAVAASMKQSQTPGLTLAVLRRGEVVKCQAYGLASVELQAPAREDTIYEIGSITKSFTATVVMDLVEEGKLRLDEPIHTYLPDLPEAWKGVTVRHLLTHTSGVPSYTDVGDFVQLARTEHTPAEIIALVEKKPLEFAPGERWAYSNSGYFLLGMIVEKVAGQSFGLVLKERVLGPLGLARTRPNAPTSIIPGRSAGYGRILGVLLNRDPLTPSAAFSAGFLVSDVNDMLKWGAAQSSDTVLTAASREMMTTPVKLNDGTTNPYGFGWNNRRRQGHRRMDHAGGTAGFSSLLVVYPDDGLVIALLANLAGGADLGAIERAVARHYIPEFDLAATRPIEDPDPELTARLRDVLATLLTGKWEESPYTPELARHLRGQAARKLVEEIGHDGKIEEFALLSQERRPSATVRGYRMVVGPSRYLTTIILDPEGKIGGLTFEKDQ